MKLPTSPFSRLLPLVFAAALLPRIAAAQPAPTPTATATPGPTPVFSINHFQCYEVHSGPFHGFGAILQDQFGTSTVQVRSPKRICNPANKNGENPAAPTARDHLVGYRIKQTVPPVFDTIRGVEIRNQFHPVDPLVVNVIRPDYLMVPSLKSQTQPPTPAPALLDHFKCYRVKGARFRRNGVTIQDQFGSIVVDIKRPVRLCVPAEKNHEGGPINPLDHLMCYQVKVAASSRPFHAAGQLFINNQFGPDTFDSFRPTELCVPSSKILAGGHCSVRRGGGLPMCGGTCPSPNQRCFFLTGPDFGGPDGQPVCTCRPLTEACGLHTGVCGGLCPNANDKCLAFSGPDMAGPDMGGPDLGGPDMTGPEACACRPTNEACGFGAASGMCGGLCPKPTDACLALSGPDMGGPDMGGPDLGGPDMTGPECGCRPAAAKCGFSLGTCGGFCAAPTDRCLSLSGPDLGGPDVSGPEAACTCRPHTEACHSVGVGCTGHCAAPLSSCLNLSGPESPASCACAF